MLDRLPNEVLHKIFSKVNVHTAKTCRLLNSRFDTIITTYELDKDNLRIISIRPTTFCYGEESSITIDIHINRKKKKTFDNYEELLTVLPHYLKKVGTTDVLRLVRIPINEKLLDILNQQKFVRYIRKCEICTCTLDANDEKKWFSFLEKLHLEELSFNTSLESSFMTFPFTIMDHIEKVLQHNTSVDKLMEMPWLVDEVVLNWFTPQKIIYLARTVIGMTVQGVIECIKMLPQNDQSRALRKFGILKNTTPELVEMSLAEANFTFSYSGIPMFNDPAIFYQITDINGRLVAYFGCLVPRRPLRNTNITVGQILGRLSC